MQFSPTPPSRRSLAFGSVIVIVALVLSAPAAAQNVQQILGEARERQQARLAGVEDITIRLQLMGVPTTTYLVAEEVEGRRTLVPADGQGRTETEVLEAAGGFWSDPLTFFDEWADRWVLEGTGLAEERPTYRISLSDFEGIELDVPTPGQENPWQPERLSLELDQEWYVPLAMVVDGVMEGDNGETRPLSVSMRFSEYQEVEGYLHPFVTVLETDIAAAGLSQEEVAEIREGLEEFRRQLDQVPQAQRAMMERMMGDQIAQMERMLSGEGIQMEIRVTELLVNAGPPAR